MTEDDGQVVVVTGSTSGVGRAVARRFADEGADVGLLARGADGLEATKRDVEEAGGEAVAVETDVSEYDDVERAADRVEAELGPIDVWVNNAMTTVFSRFTDIDPDEFERVTDVTYLGAVYGTQVAVDRMRDRGGSLVQVGSALSYRGIPLQSAYCGSKFAMRGFNESVRTELLHEDVDIDVTMVQLPAVNTPQFEHARSHMDDHPQPVAPIYQPEVAADAVFWSAHNDRREVYVGRSTVKTIWGNKIAPWLADRILARSGYESQFADVPYDENRPDYLFTPVDGDPGAHGEFDDQSAASSLQLELTKQRSKAGLLVALVVTAIIAGVLRK
jgi:NAD(P)-dependent dehydrogenase (short-subunit alcohol dehydrogenase family)